MILAVCAMILIGAAPMEMDQGELSAIVKPNSLRQIAKNLRFTEGPLWKDGTLLFSDIPADTIYQWTAGGGLTKFRSPSGNSNGLTLDNQGHLIACEHGNRRVSRTEPDGTVKALVEKYEGKRLNSPNDVIVRSDGSVYFSDPPYGVKPEQRELDFQGVFRFSPDGALALEAGDFDKPNGIAFSPDEKILYVTDTGRKHIKAFDVRPDGTLVDGRVFADLGSDPAHGPDSMKVDSRGNLFVACGGIWVFDKTGKHLGTISLPESASNCAFGEKDYTALFITAGPSVYRVDLNFPGLPPGGSRKGK